jgi:hypothetical protein
MFHTIWPRAEGDVRNILSAARGVRVPMSADNEGLFGPAYVKHANTFGA